MFSLTKDFLKIFIDVFLSLPVDPPSRLFLLRPAATMILWQTSLAHSSKKLLTSYPPISQFLAGKSQMANMYFP